MFEGLPRGHFRAILADPPWGFNLWWGGRTNKTPAGVPSRATIPHYEVWKEDELSALVVSELAANDCVLFLWTCWPVMEWAFRTIAAWSFTYKTCAFVWTKARADQLEMFRDDIDPFMGLGYWTRANTEVCLLATRGNPKRVGMDVKQAIIEPRREHSRKPDCVYERIERLVEGPYLELFARTRRPGWTSWGDEVDKFAGPRQWETESHKDYDPADDMRRSLEDCYAAVRARKAAGGPGWPQEETFADRVIREGNALARKMKHFR